MRKRYALRARTSTSDWLLEDLGSARRVRRPHGLPFLGLMIGGLLGVLMWTGFGMTAWNVFAH